MACVWLKSKADGALSLMVRASSRVRTASGVSTARPSTSTSKPSVMDQSVTDATVKFRVRMLLELSPESNRVDKEEGKIREGKEAKFT